MFVRYVLVLIQALSELKSERMLRPRCCVCLADILGALGDKFLLMYVSTLESDLR